MKLVKFFVGLIAILFVLCLITGCKTPRLTWNSSDGVVIDFNEPTPDVGDGTYDPDDWIGPVVSTASHVASRPKGLRADAPLPVGPPGPGRMLLVPLTWDHNPALDGTTEYRIYYSRQVETNKWDGFETVTTGDFQARGRSYDFRYRSGGSIRFVATAVRPPDPSYGESEPVESDRSNEITVSVHGFPESPTYFRKR